MRITFLGNHGVSFSSEAHHAKSLESLGHEVVRLQEGKATGGEVLTEALKSDMLVVVHTHGWHTPGMPLVEVLRQLREHRIPSATYHLDLWLGLQRQRDLDTDPFYKEIDHFFTVDKLMADWLNDHTDVHGHFLPAAVFDEDCYWTDKPSQYANDVIFVGSRKYHPEWPWRAELIDWLHTTYRSRFTHIGPGGVKSLRGDDLNRVYQRSKVAVGDTLCLNYDYPFYTSDRYFEAPGRGGFQIFPNIPETGWLPMPRFDFGDFHSLKTVIDRYLKDDKAREASRRECHELVKADHTYRNRWETILGIVC